MSNIVIKEGSSFSDVDPFFVPYACHIDPHTILTKNGNLIQTIKVTVFNFEIVGKKKVDLRQSIRESLTKHIPDASYAIWIHTIRRRKNLGLNANYNNDFCKSLDDAWHSVHDWSKKFVNELYITIITDGKGYKSKKLANLIQIINTSILRKVEVNYLKNYLNNLTNITNNILEDLQDFGAHKLSMTKHDGIYYSENMKFLGKIINLEEVNIPVKEQDLSTLLPYCKIAFGKNELEVLDFNRKHYASIFSIKEYSELSLRSLDKFLQLPIEFIITQTVDFINSKEALESFQHQHKILGVSKDTKLEEMAEITDMLNADHHKETDFGEQQLTIMLLADTKKQLSTAVDKTVKTFRSYGLTIVREDLFMENCFWSQLPGNFSYITRRKPINTARIGGFASLSNFPAGKMKNNKWGDAVTVFYTKNKTPYFFNFHYGSNGHTMIIGPHGTGKTVLLNFLLSQSTKFNYKLFYIDFFNSSEIFVKALGGKYHSLKLSTKEKFFNPFLSLKDDITFLKNFLSYLMIQKTELSNGTYEADPNKEKIINNIFKHIQDNNLSLNKISDLAPFFKDTQFYNFFKLWVEEGKLSHFFDNDNDIFLDDTNYLAIDVTEIAKYKAVLIPIIYYIMHKIEKLLDGRPTIIVLDEAFKLLDNPFLGNDIHGWLARLKAKNCIVIFASESIEDAKKSNITGLLTKEISTKIFLPSSDVGKEYKEIFHLTNQESEMIDKISNDARHFLLKHGNDSIIAELDLSALDHIVAILSSNHISIKIMNKIIEKTGNKPEDWVPPFQDFIAEFMDSTDVEEEDDDNYGIDEDYEAIASQEKQKEFKEDIKTNQEELIAEINNYGSTEEKT